MRLNLCLSGPDLFIEVATAFQRAAGALGHTAEIRSGITPQEGVNVYFVGHAGFMEGLRFPRHSLNILYNFEQQLPAGHERFDGVFNIFDHVRTARRPLISCPLGYSEAFNATEPAPAEESTDVFHFGALQHGSKGEVGQKYGHLITVVPFCWGAERDRRIRAAKINLIVKSLPVYHFPVLRYLLIACQRRFCLAQDHDSYSTVEPGRHVIVGRDLPRDLAHWLMVGRAARQEVADGIYERLKAERPYGASVEKALAELGRTFRC